jgi:hypothetical protein
MRGSDGKHALGRGLLSQHACTDGSFPFCGIQHWLPGCQLDQSSGVQLTRKEAPGAALANSNTLYPQVHKRKEGRAQLRYPQYFTNMAGALRKEGTYGTSWQLTI